MLTKWVLEKLEGLKDERMVLVQDSLWLLPGSDGDVHRFASDNGFTVVIASTNLVFRELLEKARTSTENLKLLVIDRAPARRRAPSSTPQAPPPSWGCP